MNQLTIAIFWLACINFASSTCCTFAATLHFKIRGGVCGVVGAKSNGTGCKITICPNGEALVGSYCGKAACDFIFPSIPVCKLPAIPGTFLFSFLYSLDGKTLPECGFPALISNCKKILLEGAELIRVEFSVAQVLDTYHDKCPLTHSDALRETGVP
uniref:HDC16240 n=1 Tax=Drosophila melanogaster TaxID=7227 RepID=Q6IJ03_DROME|nr:TPA_inf: HDC16240 [Drosophila melanogaster]